MIKFDEDSGKFVIDNDNPNKFTNFDFISIDSVDALGELVLNDNFDQNDDDGYTPLCAAILNNADPLVLLYLTEISVKDTDEELADKQLTRDNCLPEKLRDTKHANVTDTCDKGKSPLQIAITTGNITAIKILLGTYFIDVTAQQEVSLYSDTYYRDVIKYSDGLPVFITDNDGNLTDKYEYITIKIAISNSCSSKLNVTSKDILDAASMTKVNILSAISDKYKGIWYYENKLKYDSSTKAFDKYGNTPLIATAKSQCYDSAKFILYKISGVDYSHISDDFDKSQTTYAINFTAKQIGDESPVSAFSIAADNNDRGLLKIFINYLDDKASLELIFKQNNYTDLLSSFLLNKLSISDNSIFNWYYNGRSLLTEEFETSEESDISTEENKVYKKSSVLYFIENNVSNEDLKSLITNNFNECTIDQFNEFLIKDRPCYNLINNLYNEGSGELVKHTEHNEFIKSICKSIHDKNLITDRLPEDFKPIIYKAKYCYNKPLRSIYCLLSNFQYGTNNYWVNPTISSGVSDLFNDVIMNDVGIDSSKYKSVEATVLDSSNYINTISISRIMMTLVLSLYQIQFEPQIDFNSNYSTMCIVLNDTSKSYLLPNSLYDINDNCEVTWHNDDTLIRYFEHSDKEFIYP